MYGHISDTITQCLFCKFYEHKDSAILQVLHSSYLPQTFEMPGKIDYHYMVFHQDSALPQYIMVFQSCTTTNGIALIVPLLCWSIMSVLVTRARYLGSIVVCNRNYTGSIM